MKLKSVLFKTGKFLQRLTGMILMTLLGLLLLAALNIAVIAGFVKWAIKGVDDTEKWLHKLVDKFHKPAMFIDDKFISK